MQTVLPFLTLKKNVFQSIQLDEKDFFALLEKTTFKAIAKIFRGGVIVNMCRKWK